MVGNYVPPPSDDQKPSSIDSVLIGCATVIASVVAAGLIGTGYLLHILGYF